MFSRYSGSREAFSSDKQVKPGEDGNAQTTGIAGTASAFPPVLMEFDTLQPKPGLDLNT